MWQALYPAVNAEMAASDRHDCQALLGLHVGVLPLGFFLPCWEQQPASSAPATLLVPLLGIVGGSALVFRPLLGD